MTGKTIVRYPGAMLWGDHCRLVVLRSGETKAMHGRRGMFARTCGQVSIRQSWPARAVVFLAVLAVSTAAFGWGGPSHSMLAGNIFNDSIISGFATEFGVDVSAVTSWTSEPPTDWHHPGWSMVKARGYLGTYNGKDWTSLSETTRLRYLTHILFDASVPIGHSPANQVYVDTFNEGVLEAQASLWADSPNMTGQSFSGTISQVNSTFETQCVSNAQAYKNTRNWLGLHSTSENTTYGWNGQELGVKLARAVLTDYFLAKRDTIAEAGSGYAVSPGGIVTFNSAGSQDPDSITWNSNATYYNNGGGIAWVKWDVDNDGQYDDGIGAIASLSHSQVVNLIGYSETGKTIGVEVTDYEGKVGTDTSTIKVFSNPVVNASATYQTLKRNQTLYLKGSGSDADGGGVVSYAWDLDNDGQYDDATTANPEISYSTLTGLGLSAGNNYTVSMRGIDNDGAYAGQATDSFTLTMDTSYNIAPQATVTADSYYSEWYPTNLVDGGFTWSMADGWTSGAPEPNWIKLEWDEEIQFDEIKLYSIGYYNPAWTQDYNVRDFLVQIWDEATSSWVTIESVVDNLDVVYTFSSDTAYSTSAIRLYLTDSNILDGYARVLEVEVGLYGGGQQIPEPATLAVLALGGTFWLPRRKK